VAVKIGGIMQESKFFKYVWRFNGIVLMICGILAIVILIFAGYSIYLKTTRDINTVNIVNIKQGVEIKEEWQLGYMSEVQGTPYVMIPLYSNQNYATSSYDKSTSSVRNYLFINSKDNKQNWLFDNNKHMIISTDMLLEYKRDTKEQNTRAILYRAIKKDTDNDGLLTRQDLESISISLPDGSKYKELVQDIDMFIGYRTVDENILLIVYQKEGVGYSANINLSTFTISNEQELPKVGN
jgi:hypothetical protein